MGHSVYKTVPNSYAAAASSVNLGVPIAKSQKQNPISQVLIEMAREMTPSNGQETTATGGWLSRMFGKQNGN